MNIVSPSLLAADFSNLSASISAVPDAQWLHVDVMDGHFVPNLSIGVPVVESLKRATDKFLDVHLMIEKPSFFIKPFADAGADLICFHIETDDTLYVIEKIKAQKKKIGIAIKPKTPVEEVFPYLDKIDMVLIMTVEPGYGGQSFMEDMLPKLSALKAELKRRALTLDIQVDGGINVETAKKCVTAGASVLVAGSAVFGADDPNQVVLALQNCL